MSSSPRPIGAQIVGKLLVTPSVTLALVHTLMSNSYNMSTDRKNIEVEIGKAFTEKRHVVFKAMLMCIDYISLGFNSNTIPVAHVRVLRKVLVLPKRQR